MTNTEFLPPLRPLGPLRISSEPVDGHPSYGPLLHQAQVTGCCPVWVTAPDRLQPPDDPAAALARIRHLDAEAYLASCWTPNCPLCGCRDPFGGFPGLAPPGRSKADPLELAAKAEHLRIGHLTLVPADRPADVITAIGWTGPCNYGTDLAGLSAVLRSWEDRFGAVLVRLDGATLSVAAPPRTVRHAQQIAAEHLAFCRDVDGEDPRPLRAYASGLVGRSTWRFWWD